MAYSILKSYRLKVEPFAVFSALKERQHCFFLDSSLSSDYSQGRFSFLGVDPFFILKSEKQNAFKQLREGLDKYKVSLAGTDIPFIGGAVGYLAYDADLGIPASFFGFYNTVVVIDQLKKLLYISCLGFPETKAHYQRRLAETNFRKTYRLISKVNPAPCPKSRTNPLRDRWMVAPVKSNFTREDYFSAIKKAKEYIKRGDIYQVNLSQRFQARTKSSAVEIYRRLRQLSPAYFSAFFDGGEFQVLSSSPERFLKLKGDLVITRPMKGTRPRSQDRIKDRKLKEDLLKSAKDKAELMMIVDLERNDLGRVCNYDSVKVARLRKLEEYSTVFQTTATVSGILHKDKDRIDLLRACFPGGSITGCPKIRAMEIIKELEPSPRSIYTGALGYLSFSGEMDFNILIRTILKKKGMLYFGAGGGIVADSEPEKEYAETLIKARGMISAINGS